MLIEKFKEDEINYKNENIEKIKVYDDFCYDKNNLIRCSYCNNVIFYIENEIIHECPNKQSQSIKFDKLVCKINNIENKCINHQKEFQYYKNSNYYCSLCLKEKNIKDYLNLDEIKLFYQKKKLINLKN